MKKIVLYFSILVSLNTYAHDVRSIRDLHPGDTFSMRITLPANNEELKSVWDFNKSQKIDVDFHVLAIHKDSLQLAIKPTRLLAFFESLTENNSFVYFDSNYHSYFDNKEIFYLFENNSVIASVNTKDGGVTINYKDQIDGVSYAEEERSTYRYRNDWYITALNIPQGIKMSEYLKEPETNLSLNFDEIIKTALTSFSAEWKKTSNKDSTIPLMIDFRNKPGNNPASLAFQQITSASFALPPNTSIVYKAPQGTPEDRVFLSVGNRKLLPAEKRNNTYHFRFFLSSPKRSYINGLSLDITPSDSLIITFNTADKNYLFSGTGAANNSFTQQIKELYDGKQSTLDINDYSNSSLENIKNFFAESEKFFKSTLSQYMSEMNDYWLKSATLSFNYWYMTERFKLYSKAVSLFNFESLSMLEEVFKDKPDEISIPWKNKHFSQSFPFGDYLYQPYTYNHFVSEFFAYKAKEAGNTIMTGMNYLLGDISSYYFAKITFSGYPRSYLNGKTLTYMMKQFPLNGSEREYQDFLNHMNDPEIRESVVNLHEQLKKIEPGANIKELELAIEKYIPFKKNADKYIILWVYDDTTLDPDYRSEENNIKEIYKRLEAEINNVENNIKDKVNICFITSESNKNLLKDFPEIQKNSVFVPDIEIRDYTDKVITSDKVFIVLRSNGEVLNRYHSSKHIDSVYFIIELIQKDILRQKNQDSAYDGVFTIIFSVLISILITFFLVRHLIIRRERVKRHIQELELKAIRAQINPHFTFNALGSIQNLISQKKDKEANQYLVNFAKLLRMVLSTSEKKLVPLSDEINLLHLYLELEQLRVPFDYTITTDPRINTETEEIPGMLIQPIVENAVKHGIIPKGEGDISILFKLVEKAIEVEVIDTGDGFTEFDNYKGFGIKSVQDRLQLLNKELHLNISLKLENIAEGSKVLGAKVTLYIPI